MQIINQNSFLVIAGLTFLGLLIYFLRRGLGRNEIISLAALLIGLAIAMYLFNPGDTSTLPASSMEDSIGDGTPVLLEFQSPY